MGRGSWNLLWCVPYRITLDRASRHAHWVNLYTAVYQRLGFGSHRGNEHPYSHWRNHVAYNTIGPVLDAGQPTAALRL